MTLSMVKFTSATSASLFTASYLHGFLLTELNNHLKGIGTQHKIDFNWHSSIGLGLGDVQE
jgi:hypothetical protein